MKKIIAIIFWVYKSKKSDMPYVATLLTIVGLIFIHICQAILLLGLPVDFFFPFELENPVHERWLNASLILTPLIIVFCILFKKSALEKQVISDQEIQKGKKMIPIYFGISFLILIGLLVWEGIKKGTL